MLFAFARDVFLAFLEAQTRIGPVAENPKIGPDKTVVIVERAAIKIILAYDVREAIIFIPAILCVRKPEARAKFIPVKNTLGQRRIEKLSSF